MQCSSHEISAYLIKKIVVDFFLNKKVAQRWYAIFKIYMFVGGKKGGRCNEEVLNKLNMGKNNK